MQIILSPNCKSFTGTISREHGYYIRSTKNGRFFAQRSKHSVPPDGHWKFIVACAEMANSGFIIADIKVKWDEVRDALREARHWVAADAVFRNADRQIKSEYDANNILNLKITFSL